MNTRAVVSAGARQVDGTFTEVTSGKHTWYIDEPAPFGGEDRAPSPVQAMLGALAGCLVAAGRQAAGELGLPLCQLECSISGQICSDRFFGKTESRERAGFREIVITFKGPPDWTPAQRSLWTAEVLERCPVMDNLLFETPIKAVWQDGCEGMDSAFVQDR